MHKPLFTTISYTGIYHFLNFFSIHVSHKNFTYSAHPTSLIGNSYPNKSRNSNTQIPKTTKTTKTHMLQKFQWEKEVTQN